MVCFTFYFAYVQCPIVYIVLFAAQEHGPHSQAEDTKVLNPAVLMGVLDSTEATPPNWWNCMVRPRSISLLPFMLPLQLDWLTSSTRLMSSTRGSHLAHRWSATSTSPPRRSQERELDSGYTGGGPPQHSLGRQ